MRFFCYCFFGLAFGLVVSCSKMDDTYHKFIKNGPIVYPGKADSVTVHPGHDRVQLSWWLGSPQTVVSCKVFWNFGADSVSVPVGHVAGVADTITTYIDSLTEGSYSFTVYTYDQAGNQSVGSSAIGNVYGDIYQSTLNNRPVRTTKFDTTGAKVTIAWVGIDINCLGTQWTYTGTDNLPKTFYSPIGDTTILTGCKVTSPVSYRSLFVPEADAIDTFYTVFINLKH